MSRFIEFEHATLGYGRKAVLSGVEMKVPEGAFVGILGPNGSGKTTLLRTILGLLEPIDGTFRLRWGGRPPRFGYVPQKEKLDPIYPLSAYEVAEMGTFRRVGLLDRLRGISQGPRVRRCLEECGVSDLARLRYSDLSGGQRQRVLVARALAADAEVLVLDEPLSGVDASTRKELLDLFESFKKRDLTVLMVSHRIQREKALFTHVAWMDEGKVNFGTASSLLSDRSLHQLFESEL